jgi:phenylalanyl-tRNA synthetase beta chain
MILIRLGFKTEMLTLEECSADIYREGISYTQNGKHIVTIGMLSHKVLKPNDIEQEVYYAEFSWENILKAIKNHTITFTPMLSSRRLNATWPYYSTKKSVLKRCVTLLSGQKKAC